MSHEKHNKATEEAIRRSVKEQGWYVCLFEADTATPAFAYTIGLWENFKHPELICFGMPITTMHLLLNDVREWVRGGQQVELGTDNFELLEQVPVQFRAVDADNIADYFGYGRWFYNYQDFAVIQLIWPDKNSNFPWSTEFDPQYEFDQPLLDQKLDFKFFEPRNTAAFVARQILKENKPILRVRHDQDDGAWHFLTGETVMTDDIMVVALEQITKRDPTINDLFNMPTGQVATRKLVGGKWERKQVEDEE